MLKTEIKRRGEHTTAPRDGGGERFYRHLGESRVDTTRLTQALWERGRIRERGARCSSQAQGPKISGLYKENYPGDG